MLIADPGREREAAVRLARIGFDRVEGHLSGGPAAFLSRPELVRRLSRCRAPELAAALASDRPPVVLDVRADAERRAGRIEGSLHIPLPRLPERIGDVPRDRPLVVHCAGGYRSMIAASLLLGGGITSVSDLEGGFAAWERMARRR